MSYSWFLNLFNWILNYRVLDLPTNAVEEAGAGNFELKGYQFTAAKEETRSPRIVRIAVVQNEIVKPTTAPIIEQVRIAYFY